MKLAWIVQKYEDSPEDVGIVFEEPRASCWYFRITPIVYAEIQK